jgi:hypothetical protein
MGMGMRAKRRSVAMLMEELKTPMFLKVTGSKHLAVLKIRLVVMNVFGRVNMSLPGWWPQSEIVPSSYWYTLEDDRERRADGEHGDEGC